MIPAYLAACLLATTLIGATVPRIVPLFFLCLGLSAILLATRYPDTLAAFAVLLLGFSLVLGRILRMLGSDLVSVFWDLGVVKLLRLLLWAAVLTLPVAVLAWLGLDFGQMRTNVVLYGCGQDTELGVFNAAPADSDVFVVTGPDGVDRLLARVNSAHEPRPPLLAPISSRVCPAPDQRFNLEASMIASVSQYSSNLHGVLRARIEDWVGKARDEGKTGSEAATYALFGEGNCDGVIPKTIQKTSDGCGTIVLEEPCKWYRWFFHIGECAGREVKHTVQKAIILAYSRAYDQFYRNWMSRQSEVGSQMDDAGAATISATDLFLSQYLDPAEATAIDAIGFSFGLWTTVSWVLFGWTVTVILKVFIYIFARLGFAPNGGGLFLSLRPNNSPHHETPEMQLISRDYAFSIPLTQAWFASRSGAVTWEDLQPLSRLPRPGQMLIKRILTGKLLWMKYEPSKSLHDISGNHSHSSPIAEVRLPAGTRVVIDIGRLEAFTEGVRLRTVFNSRLAAFLQRRLFFTEASGPGSILLSGREGAVWKVGEEGRPRAVEAETVIAMDRFGSYGCLSGTDPVSLLLNSPTIHPKPGIKSMMVATAKPKGARAMFGWLRYVGFFLLG